MTTDSRVSWKDLDGRLYAELKGQERSQLLAITSEKALTARLNVLRDQRQALTREGTWGRLNKVTTLLKPVAHAADILARGACLPSQTLWGALGLIVDLIGSRAEALDTVLYAFDSLLSSLPRAPTFETALEQSPHLRLAITDVYDAYTALSIRSVKIFGRGHRLSMLNTFSWMRDRKLLQNSIQSLEGLVRKAQLEAGYALQEHRHAESSQAVKEALRNTEQILSNLSLRNERSPKTPKLQASKFIAPSRNPSFAGRTRWLEDIHKHLCPPPPPYTQHAEQSLRSVVLCGMGGVGKSQLALEYAYRYRESFQACFWITCDSVVRATDGFSEIARILELDGLNLAQTLGHVKDWLHTTDDTWLLIFDNAESPSAMTDFWPRSSKGAVLLTTQDGSWLSQEYVTEGFRLDTLVTEEAVDLVTSLFERKSRKISPKDALAISEETGGLPLAIRQITSYILAESLSTDKFLQIYRDRRGARSVDAWDESTTPWYSHTLATFLDVAFAKLNQRAILILAIVSFLDADKIQESLLCDETEQSDDDGDEAVFDGLIDYDVDISRLCRYSVISKSRDKQGVYLTVHRQVKRHVQNRLSSQLLAQGFQWVVRRLRQLFPRQSPFAGEVDDSNPNCAPCIKHILALKSALPTVKDGGRSASQTLASLCLDGGIYLWAKGLLTDGTALTSKAKELCDTGQVDQPMTAQIYSFHASVVSDSGDIAQGLEYFERSLEVLKRHLTAIRDTVDEFDRALLANAYNNLAAVHYALGNYDKAEMYNEISLLQKQKLVGCGQPMSHLFCLTFQNMASTLAAQMRYDEAAGYFKKAMEAATLKESTSRRALTAHNFGMMRLEEGKADEARALFDTAYQLRSKKMGEHPDTAASMHMLACCYHELGDPDSMSIARHLLRGALLILESRSSNIDESRVARSLFKLSLVEEALDDPATFVSRRRASELHAKITGAKKPPESEEEFDVLVPYI